MVVVTVMAQGYWIIVNKEVLVILTYDQEKYSAEARSGTPEANASFAPLQLLPCY